MWEQNWIGTAVLSLCAVYAFWAIYARVCARMYTGGAARVTEDSDNKHANTHARKRAHDWGHAIAEFGARGTDEGGGCASGLPRHAHSFLVGGVSGSNAASERLPLSRSRIGAAVLSSITIIALRTFVVVVAGCSNYTSGCSSPSASLLCGVPMRCRTCESCVAATIDQRWTRHLHSLATMDTARLAIRKRTPLGTRRNRGVARERAASVSRRGKLSAMACASRASGSALARRMDARG